MVLQKAVGMKLSQRLQARPAPNAFRPPQPSPPALPGEAAAEQAAPTSAPAPASAHSPSQDPLAHLKQRVQEALFARLGTRLYDSSISEDQLNAYVQQELGLIVEQERAPLSGPERKRLNQEVSDDVLGYGPVQRFLDDAEVTEVMVNATSSIYVERAGKLFQTDSRFLSEEHLRRIIERIVSQVGRRIDESSPMVDARLPDGSRVNAVVPPLAVQGPILTIRKFAREAYSVGDLVGFGTITQDAADFLSACVEGKLNILVTGGTGSGKTTLLNVLSSFIPTDERIVTIEDAVELRLSQDHVVNLESRPPNIEGRGAVTIRDLVRNALRMRPDRIVVGEVRGAEALDMLQAMNTGHEGSLSTVHANTPRDAMARVETMVLMAGMELPVRAIREQIASALDLVVHLSRLRDGSRRITHITEVEGMEGQVITMQDLFVFDFDAGVGDGGRFQGSLAPTGLVPGFLPKLKEWGVKVPDGVFGRAHGLGDLNGGRGR
jgi:pilus assembly protein CpaF